MSRGLGDVYKRQGMGRPREAGKERRLPGEALGLAVAKAPGEAAVAPGLAAKSPYPAGGRAERLRLILIFSRSWARC